MRYLEKESGTREVFDLLFALDIHFLSSPLLCEKYRDKILKNKVLKGNTALNRPLQNNSSVGTDLPTSVDVNEATLIYASGEGSPSFC